MKCVSYHKRVLRESGRGLAWVCILLSALFVLVEAITWSHIALAADMGQKIADKAKELAWPEGKESESLSAPTDAFVEATNRVNTPNNNDCLSFVKTVVRDSGADTDFPNENGPQESDLVEYMTASSKWEQIDTTNEADLKPGDILVSADTSGQGRKHIFVFIGDGKVGDANLNAWYGRIEKLEDQWWGGGVPFYYSGNKYKVFRNVSSGSSSSSNNRTSVGAQKSQIPAGQLEEFAQNDIIFYDPSDCVEGADGNTLCSDDGTARGVYWSVLSTYFNDPIKIAGVVGNLANEGGMNPVAWEGYPSSGNGGVNGSGELVGGWDAYYNGTIQRTGVGAFAITSGLNNYLHYVNENAPEYVNYFKNTKEYSYNFLWHPGCAVDSNHSSYGDCLLEKIGAAEFRKLVEFEVAYALGDNFNPTTTKSYMDKNFSTPTEAAIWWMDEWERPRERNPDARGRDAEKAYDDYKDFSCSTGGNCPKLAELRTRMWTEASQTDRENFMYVVEREDYTIAGVEGFMNQVISKHGVPSGKLSDWLDHQCYEFGGGMSCRGDHTITSSDQDMINEALAGSNHIKFAMGNATGGSGVGAGKIVCVWDGTKCREDVDYSAEGGTGVCSVYSPSPEFGECWGLEGDDDWAAEMERECGASSTGTSASSNATSSSNTGSLSASGQVSGSEITWIGDSDSALATDSNGNHLVQTIFPGVDYGPSFNDSTSYIQSCKGISSSCTSNNPSGLEIVRKLVGEGKLRKYLVFALGGNDGWTQDSMNTFLRLVGNDTKVILTTTKYRGADYTENNALVKKTANEHDNIYVADVAANYKDEYMDSSGIEFTAEGAEMFMQTIKDALEVAAGGSGVPYRSGVEWDNGWIVPGTMEGLVIEDVTTGDVQLSESQVQPIGAYTTDGGKPNKILLHSTDGSTPGLAAYPSNNMYPAHFTIDVKNKSISQHFSIYQPSMAVGVYDKEGPIQFEIVGFSEHDVGYTPEYDLFNYSDEDWEYLAKVMIAINEETGIPLTSSVDWAHGNNELSPDEFKKYEGVLGHMHTPENEKIDPGDIWKFVSAAIERLRGSDGCTTYVGEYPEYIQSDEPWGSMPYGGSTMASAGCGAVSMAMLATVAAGQDVLPTDIANLLGDEYYNSTSVSVLDPKVGEYYGFEVKTDTSSSVEETKTKFRQYLQDGYMIHFTGAGCYTGFQWGDYCSAGHVIGLFSIDGNDKVMQANPAFGGNQEASLDEMAKAKLWDDFTAIKGGGGSTKACNSGVCKNNSGTNSSSVVSSAGLTKEQAQKVADYYNSDRVSASNFIDGVIPSSCAKVNCVSFSYWFVSAFTDASEKGATSGIIGDGSYIADTGLPGLGWQTGNDPTPFSVFGGSGSSAWSHTGVVVGTADDGEYLTIEAAYCAYGAKVMTKPASYFANGVGILAYPGDHFTPDKEHLGNQSLNEIIGN